MKSTKLKIIYQPTPGKNIIELATLEDIPIYFTALFFLLPQTTKCKKIFEKF